MNKNITPTTEITVLCFILFGLFLISPAMAATGNISDTDKYAWSENAGWLNFKSTHGGVTVYDTHLTGFAWAENIGWVKLGADSGGSGVPHYANTSSTDWGVNRDNTGKLSGFAWSETVGWINFNPSHSQVTIDANSNLSGYAWSENVGWIHFKNSTPPYNVRAIVAEPVATIWGIEGLDVFGAGGANTSIELDNSDAVHISYFDAINADLKYGTDTSETRIFETIDSDGDVGRYHAIAIDELDKVHISYYDSTNQNLKYATNALGTWLTETVDSAANVGEYASIATDESYGVHISYYDATNKDLKYATNSSGSWVIEIVDSIGDVGQFCDIETDELNKAHISYYDSTNKDLKYATNASGTWVIETVDSSQDIGQYSSIELDGFDKAHISYYDSTNQDLKYATNLFGTWLTETVDSSGSVGQHTSITLDASDEVHISYYDTTNQDLKYASTKTAGSWVAETLDSIGNVGQNTSIDLNRYDEPFICYYDLTNQDLKVAAEGGVDSPTNHTEAIFTIGGADITHYKYSLDGGNYSSEIPVGIELTLSALTEGPHELSIIGKNAAGDWQSEANATTTTWVVDFTSSAATLSGTPADPTSSTSATFIVGGTDILAYRFKLDDGSYSSEIPVGDQIGLIGLIEGTHTLSVIGKDAAENWQAEAGATTATWTVDLTAPVVNLTTPAS
ncbi:MAG: hypothetical protein ACYTBZ_28640, partial [Planctomycetota bacterium]